ncbi:16S rRNA (cytidine(1402)-2'-O)-methyltransferase [Coraliomargarita akajimensis]|uniref:Ribosomal RNA small subunit methyltransferase I n=1 Tax=Coraliomargarita akajimensis (strain DSM 45221 / IAM 15411 / JCM 23193 / KCTC 12865 / 04OKA010-24) TaxID=583355 RepID=D5EMV0_CORAD|nr:16S rRNA (cytidine(1402)-2'-O)-methyltransferase [Coraliomargarita akajimensis]ADE55340.1 Uroporphyrin-III C/tetrapyrrole (Corrin/Porphyrin) methyltransferase [Coraliomargarita akajimensis DSM 45221]
MSIASDKGTLTLVAVPIGNLGDIPRRAIETLQNAECIACEDTRITGKLLAKLEIVHQAELISYRDENEKFLAEPLADRIAQGESIVLVSDAGTPAISDPGFRLVRECRKRRLTVTSVPGPSAAITALSISGLPSDGFFYGGFLAPKSAARKRFFTQHQDFGYSIILYESCHRIGKFLNDLVETLGPDRCISVCRELTKLHETVHTGPASEVRDRVAQGSQKGEFVVLIAKNGFVL